MTSQLEADFFAPGIKNRRDLGDISRFIPESVHTLVVQKHEAERAGEHYDLRIGGTDGLLSWALPSAKLPDPGEKVLAVRQPVHEYSYKDFEGKIEKGYGKGNVVKVLESQVLVFDSDPDYPKFIFTVLDQRYPQRYLLLKPRSSSFKDTDWILANITPSTPVGIEKVSLPLLSESDFHELVKNDENEGKFYFQPKLDGALCFVQIDDNGRIELYGPRISKVTGRPIVYTEKVTGRRLKFDTLPNKHRNSILLAELVGIKTNPDGTKEVIAPQELSAILNSSLTRALQTLKEMNVELKAFVFDVAKHAGQFLDFNRVGYTTRRKIIADILNQLNSSKFDVVPDYSKLYDAIKLWNDIKSGVHPLTKEGIVIYKELGIPKKVKTFKEADVYIRKIETGSGKYQNDYAATIYYSREPNGPIVGSVGSGFTDAFRRFLYQNKDDLVGRVIRISYLDEYPTGAFRAPVFIALHEDYPTKREKRADGYVLPENNDNWYYLISRLNKLRDQLNKTNDSTEKQLILKKEACFSEWGGSEALTEGPCAAFSYITSRILESFILKKAAEDIDLPFATGASKSVLDKCNLRKLAYIAADMHGVDFAEEVYRGLTDLYVKEAKSVIDVDEWGKTVLDSDRLNQWEKTMLVTVPLVASIVHGDDRVTVSDIASTAAKMQLGEFAGHILGSIASNILRLPESIRKNFVDSGKFVGLTKGLLGTMRGVHFREDPYVHIRQALQI